MTDFLDHPTLLTRFWQRINKTDTCWLWTGGKTTAGYGHLGYSKKGRIYTHRLSYLIHYGDIPEGMVICHRCDTPACVNPDHLFLGSQTDNMRDARDKRRMNPPRKFTDEIVRQVVADFHAGELIPDIAIKYGISRRNAYSMVRGRIWKHLWTEQEIAERRATLRKQAGYNIWRSRRRNMV